jgi:hypothetical protein
MDHVDAITKSVACGQLIDEVAPIQRQFSSFLEMT